MPCEKPRKKMRPKGRILHFAGSRSKIFQVSPEPKRCVERKALNSLLRIIAKLPPFVGGIRQNPQATATPRLLPWKGYTLPLIHSFIPQPKSYAENQEKSVCVGPVSGTVVCFSFEFFAPLACALRLALPQKLLAGQRSAKRDIPAIAIQESVKVPYKFANTVVFVKIREV